MFNYRRKLMLAQRASEKHKNLLPPEYQEVEYISGQEASCLSLSGFEGHNPEYEIGVAVTNQYLGQKQTFFTSGDLNNIRSPSAILDLQKKEFLVNSPFIINSIDKNGVITTSHYDHHTTKVKNLINSYRVIQRNGWLSVYYDKVKEDYEVDIAKNQTWYIAASDKINIAGEPGAKQGGLYGNLLFFRFWLDKTMVMDLVPCYEKATGLVGMYNLVDKTFHVSDGLYPFGNGPDIQ